MPVPNLEIFQYSPPDGTWEGIPGFEGQVVEDFWKDIFSPDAVAWWAVGWKTGDIVYYAWELQNACSGMVLAPGVVGELPGPPGPPGQLGQSFRGAWDPTAVYQPGDSVTYDGGTYFCTANNTTGGINGSNILTNNDSGFEGGVGSWVGIGTAVAQDTTKARSGSASLKLTASGTAEPITISGNPPNYTVRPGKYYQCSMWAQCSNINFPNANAQFWSYNAAGNLMLVDQAPGPHVQLGIGNWQQCTSGFYKAPVGGATAALVFANVDPTTVPSGANYWIDDCLFYEVTPNPTQWVKIGLGVQNPITFNQLFVNVDPRFAGGATIPINAGPAPGIEIVTTPQIAIPANSRVTYTGNMMYLINSTGQGTTCYSFPQYQPTNGPLIEIPSGAGATAWPDITSGFGCYLNVPIFWQFDTTQDLSVVFQQRATHQRAGGTTAVVALQSVEAEIKIQRLNWQ